MNVGYCCHNCIQVSFMYTYSCSVTNVNDVEKYMFKGPNVVVIVFLILMLMSMGADVVVRFY